MLHFNTSSLSSEPIHQILTKTSINIPQPRQKSTKRDRASAQQASRVLACTSLSNLYLRAIRLSHAPSTRRKVAVNTATMDRLRQAADQTRVAVTAPTKWVNMYGDFITKNAGAVGQVEGALRSLTYIIPGMRSIRPKSRSEDGMLTWL